MKTREEVIRALEQCTTTDDICDGENCPYFVSEDYGCEMLEMKIDALALLKEQPEIVRCKDCVDWKRRECGTYGYCDRHDGFFDQNWYCADGERKV